MLSKPAEVIGDYVSLACRARNGLALPAGDKEKWFKSTVRQFEGVHNSI